MFGPLNVFRSLPEASSTHSATAQQSPQGSSMKGLCAVVGIGTTAVLHSVLKMRGHPIVISRFYWSMITSDIHPRISNFISDKEREETKKTALLAA